MKSILSHGISFNLQCVHLKYTLSFPYFTDEETEPVNDVLKVRSTARVEPI